MTNPKVICLGEALIDRLGPLGGDPLLDKPCKDCFGGAPANVSCALGRLGTEVAFVGSVGNDKSGQDFKALMTSRGVNTLGLQINENFPTRVVLVRRELDGERSFGGFTGDKGRGFADQMISLEFLAERWSSFAAKAEWLLTGTIPIASRKSSEALWWAVDKALSANIRIGLDLNWRPTFWGNHLAVDAGPDESSLLAIAPLLKVASLLKLAKEEAFWFFDTDDPTVISNSLPNKPDVLVTDGSKPIKWLLANIVGETKAIKPPSIIDTTGAGDCFTAGLLYKYVDIDSSLHTHEKINEIISFAIACGSLVCSGMGAIDPQPTINEVNKFISQIT